MLRASSWLTAAGFFLAAAAPANPPVSPYAHAQPATTEGGEVQILLAKLTTLSESIGKNSSSPQAWRQQLAQGEVLLQLASRAQGKERDNWLRMAVDSHYGAAVQSPENEPAAYQRLEQLPAQLAQAFPGNPVAGYAVRQAIQAEYTRALGKAGEDPSKCQERFRDRLMAFARAHPQAEEAAKAVMEAGEVCEMLGKAEEARNCYRHLAEHFPRHALARKARGALHRLGLVGDTVHLRLPLLYSDGSELFDTGELRDRVMVVYFWSSASPGAAEDLQALKDLSGRYRARGLTVVMVNLDDDPAKARSFLAGRLTAGAQLHEKGGLDGAVAERYGIGALPQVFVVGRDGKLIEHFRQTAPLEKSLPTHLGVLGETAPRQRRWRGAAAAR
jgi:hypothetical protein